MENLQKPIISNPFFEHKNIVLKDKIKSIFVNEIAQNFGVNFKVPNMVTEVENYFSKNKKLVKLIEKEKLTVTELETLKNAIVDEIVRYKTNMEFIKEIAKSDKKVEDIKEKEPSIKFSEKIKGAQETIAKVFEKTKYWWLATMSWIKTASGVSSKCLGYLYKNKGKVIVGWIVLTSLVHTFTWIQNSTYTKAIEKNSKSQLSANIFETKEFSSNTKGLDKLNGKALFEETVKKVDNYNDSNITQFVQDNFIWNSNYKNFINSLYKEKVYNKGYGFEFKDNDEVRKVVLIQKWVKEHNIKKWVYKEDHLEQEKESLNKLNEYLNDFNNKAIKDFQFDEWNLRFSIKTNENDWKTYIDLDNI